MRCLILGGAGFIGSHIVKHLVSAGHGVRILDLKPNPYFALPQQVECVWSDWNDSDEVKRAVTDIDVVVHLICTAWPGMSNPGVVTDVSSNLLPTLQLLQICLQAGVRKVIFLSSGGTVYGVPQYTPIDETHQTFPICSYGVIKLFIERYLHLFFHSYGLEYVILRGANVYGEYQNPQRSQGAVNVFLGHLARRQPIEIWGDGQITRDFLYVGDMARAVQHALEPSLTSEIFNIGSGQGTTLNDLIDVIKRTTGMTPAVHYQPGRIFDVPVNVLAIEKSQRVLGWSPEVSLNEGVQQTWDWIRHVC